MTTELIQQTQAGNLSISAVDFEAILTKHYTEDQAEILRFWFFTARERNWNLGALSKQVGISTTTLYRLFRGEYDASPVSSCAKLARSRDNYRESSDNPDFIQTSLANQMFTVFDKTRALKNVSIMWGVMGIGKTEIIKEYYRRNNSGRTAWVRFPTGATFGFFVAHVARSLGVATSKKSVFELRDMIIRVLKAGQRLLIVDELHQAFLTTRSDSAVRCCEFLREIADEASCGLCLVGTEVLKKNIFEGAHKDALSQLVDRGTIQIPLPSKATRKDYEKFLEAYGMQFPTEQEPEAASILSDIMKTAGLRKFTLHLRDGESYAKKCDETYHWRHFVAAYKAIQSLCK